MWVGRRKSTRGCEGEEDKERYDKEKKNRDEGGEEEGNEGDVIVIPLLLHVDCRK